MKVFKKAINLIKCTKGTDYNIGYLGKNQKNIVCFMGNMEKIYTKLVMDNILEIIEEYGIYLDGVIRLKKEKAKKVALLKDCIYKRR